MNAVVDGKILSTQKAVRSLGIPSLSLQSQRRLLQLALIACDGVMLSASLALAYWLRFDLQIGLSSEIAVRPAAYAVMAAVLLVSWLVLFGLFKLYDFKYLLGGTEEYSRVLQATSAGVMVMVVLSFLEPTLQISRAWLVFAWFLSFLLVGTARFAVRRVVYWLRRYRYFVAPALVVGTNDEAIALSDQLASWRTSGLLVLGFVDSGTSQPTTRSTRLPVLGGLDTLSSCIQEYGVKELIVATSAVTPDHLLELFRGYGVSDRVNLRLSSGLFDVFTTGLYVKELGYVPLVSVNKMRLTPLQSLVKSFLDYVGALVLLFALSPVFLAIAIAIKLDSPGPVIYRRRVLGRGGRVFDAYKFRSMVVHGDERLTPDQWAELQTHHKLREDPRITRVGHLLRKYSLDELPQLLNVLKGQMSLIGPRMITPAEQQEYGKWDLNLLTVKPGLSGLWQVSGRSDVSYEERVSLDMRYIRSYSVWVDIHLILRTIAVVLRGRGAY